MVSIKKFLSEVGLLTFSLTLAFIVFVGVTIVQGVWTAPTDQPPAGNTPEPLNVSNNNQIKSGSLEAQNLKARGIFEAPFGIAADFYVGSWVSRSGQAGANLTNILKEQEADFT